MGKKLEDKYRLHWDCENYGHLPVIETSDGHVWHLVNNQPAHELGLKMSDDYHPAVQLLGYVYPEEHFLEIQSYRLTEAVTNP